MRLSDGYSSGDWKDILPNPTSGFKKSYESKAMISMRELKEKKIGLIGRKFPNLSLRLTHHGPPSRKWMAHPQRMHCRRTCHLREMGDGIVSSMRQALIE